MFPVDGFMKSFLAEPVQLDRRMLSTLPLTSPHPHPHLFFTLRD